MIQTILQRHYILIHMIHSFVVCITSMKPKSKDLFKSWPISNINFQGWFLPNVIHKFKGLNPSWNLHGNYARQSVFLFYKSPSCSSRFCKYKVAVKLRLQTCSNPSRGGCHLCIPQITPKLFLWYDHTRRRKSEAGFFAMGPCAKYIKRESLNIGTFPMAIKSYSLTLPQHLGHH